ncbi:MAG: exosortase K [Deltaproteobacteria bacterium HGW-Deltaproteobacteria-15]|jgi:exosortase K|nr:MAG: exosortase K [Deltaproteobacteria bacterium HGW-Deltaproteobacteria-15]
MRSMKSLLIAYGAPYAVGVILAVGLKYHYSVSGSEDLRWVLSPTAWVVQRLTAISFEWEEHTGFVSRSHGLIIAPSCAGVNFLIIAFSTLYFTTIRLMPSVTWKGLWFGVTLGISFILTVGVNGLRIVAAVSLYQADIYGGWLTPERAHRIEGTLIYFSALLMAYQVVTRAVNLFISRGPVKASRWSLLVPFLWYSLIALGIPLLNNSGLRGEIRFIEHGFLVLSVCAGVLIVVMALFFLFRSAAIRIGVGRKNGKRPQGQLQCH